MLVRCLIVAFLVVGTLFLTASSAEAAEKTQKVVILEALVESTYNRGLDHLLAHCKKQKWWEEAHEASLIRVFPSTVATDPELLFIQAEILNLTLDQLKSRSIARKDPKTLSGEEIRELLRLLQK
jgi:NAD(P)H-dependent flavin oxidoreductase YrpB (nitropropane dioxygenase family)